MKRSLLASFVATVASWSTCEFPAVDWMVVDSGVGKSATQKVTTLGTTTFIGGYAGGTTTLSSTTPDATPVTNTETDWLSPCSYGCTQTGELDMHISKIADDGTPETMWIFHGYQLGSSPGWSVLHGMEDGEHIAAVTSISGNLTLPSGTMISNEAVSGNTGLVIKLKSDGTIPWYKTFPSSAGSSVSSADGDAQGNMYVNYKTCVPCVSDCVPGVDGYGRPTGMNAPTCTRSLAKLAALDGTVDWKTDMPLTGTSNATSSMNPGHIRLLRTGGSGAAAKMYTWGEAMGVGVSTGDCNFTSGSGGTDETPVIFEWDASDGTANWCTAVGTKISSSSSVYSEYIDLSPSTSSPVLAVQGGFSGTVGFGSVNLTASYGYYTSYVARLSTTDGHVVWAEQTPMGRGVQVTPDNKYVGVFAQTTGDTDAVTLTDTGGATTIMRSRGSWDLIAMKLDAADGAGVYAIDGGGDGMEYFHGFGMNSDGDMLISGYSRSSSFHFGDHSMPNNQSASRGGDGANKIFTIQVSANSSMPSCISSCDSGTPAIAANKCFIDNYCYDDQVNAPYPARACFKCDAATNPTDWTGPDTSNHCFISSRGVGNCYAADSSKPGMSSRSPPSACQACLPDKDTDNWAIRDGFDYVSSACVGLASISTTSTDALTTAMAASTKVKEISDAISGAADTAAAMTAAKDLYVGSTLQTLAKTSWAGTADYDQAATYFNSTTWMDDYIMSALDATGQFAGTLADARGPMGSARAEAVKKGVQDQILSMAAISSIASSPTTEANWDLAYAYYYGDTWKGAPYHRANKRSSNYVGTRAADGLTAKLNFKVFDAIAAGKAACTAGEDGAADAEAAAAAYSDFRALVLGIYFQAALRYSYLLDNDIATDAFTSDHQGEGGAFWRVIAPLMHSKDPLLTQYVTDFYDMRNAPVGTGNRYCPLLYLLSNHLPSGFSSTDMGTLEVASGVTCMAGIQLPASPSAALVAAWGASAEVKLVTGSGGLGNETTPFVKAKAIYIASTLQALSKTDYEEGHEGHDHGDEEGHESYYHMNVEYFGSATWIDDYMLTAFDATGQFAGTLANARGDMSAARTEAVKKGAQDQILVNAALGALKNPQVAASWYMFYAYWTGQDPSGAPWKRANKRCKNYATCGGGTTGGGGELATTNSKILLATLSALESPASNGAAQKMVAMAQVKVVYYQAALRYSYLLDNDIATDAATSDHQGEGGAFWRVIEAEMAAVDAPTAEYVSNFYNMTTVPEGTNRYCPLAALLHANMPGSLTVAEMGTLQGSSVTLPTCATPVTADTEGAQKTTLVIIAPGSVEDYPVGPLTAAVAKELDVYPSEIVVTVAAVLERRRRLQSSGGVTITIDVYTATASEASSISTKLTTMAGTASAASTFLTAATGKTVEVTEDPAAPTTTDAQAPPVEESGLGGGAIAGIIIAVVVVILIVALLVFRMSKKKAAAKAPPKTVTA